jgi:hypothetical protein
MRQVIEECAASAVSRDWQEGTTRRYDLRELSQIWAGARKGRLRLLSDALEFEEWRIPYTDLDAAVLTHVNGLGAGYFLRIRAKGKPYQFSILGASHFMEELPFEVTRESTDGITWPKLALRILAAGVFLAVVVWACSRR